MYIVKKRVGRSETMLQEFLDERNAEHFIYDKLREDVRFKIAATYCLYEGVDLFREFTQHDIPATLEGHSDTAAGGDQVRGQVFSPTPLKVALAPGGMQQHWKDVPKDDAQEK